MRLTARKFVIIPLEACEYVGNFAQMCFNTAYSFLFVCFCNSVLVCFPRCVCCDWPVVFIFFQLSLAENRSNIIIPFICVNQLTGTENLDRMGVLRKQTTSTENAGTWLLGGAGKSFNYRKPSSFSICMNMYLHYARNFCGKIICFCYWFVFLRWRCLWILSQLMCTVIHRF